MEVLIENENLTLEYHHEGRYIIETWRGFTSDSTFAQLVDKIYEYSEQKGIKGKIIDVSAHKGLSPVAQKYAAEKLEKFTKDFWDIKEAIIVPTDVFSKFSVDSYVKELNEKTQKVSVKYFDRLSEAKAWMED